MLGGLTFIKISTFHQQVPEIQIAIFDLLKVQGSIVALLLDLTVGIKQIASDFVVVCFVQNKMDSIFSLVKIHFLYIRFFHSSIHSICFALCCPTPRSILKPFSTFQNRLSAQVRLFIFGEFSHLCALILSTFALI